MCQTGQKCQDTASLFFSSRLLLPCQLRARQRCMQYVEQPVQVLHRCAFRREQTELRAQSIHCDTPCGSAVQAQRKVLQQQSLQAVKLDVRRPSVANTVTFGGKIMLSDVIKFFQDAVYQRRFCSFCSSVPLHVVS